MAEREQRAHAARVAELKVAPDKPAAAAATPPAEQARVATEATRLATARGGLSIRTEPAGAEVRVGAVALEKAPLTLKELKLGKYPVRVRLAGYEDWDGEVEVKENDFAELTIPLVRGKHHRGCDRCRGEHLPDRFRGQDVCSAG